MKPTTHDIEPALELKSFQQSLVQKIPIQANIEVNANAQTQVKRVARLHLPGTAQDLISEDGNVM
jgi:hypothetical protein